MVETSYVVVKFQKTELVRPGKTREEWAQEACLSLGYGPDTWRTFYGKLEPYPCDLNTISKYPDYYIVLKCKQNKL